MCHLPGPAPARKTRDYLCTGPRLFAEAANNRRGRAAGPAPAQRGYGSTVTPFQNATWPAMLRAASFGVG